jgi:hypothetical protein
MRGSLFPVCVRAVYVGENDVGAYGADGEIMARGHYVSAVLPLCDLDCSAAGADAVDALGGLMQK